MNQRDIVAAGTLANQNGVKGVFYGPPGTGKTPLIQTAPRPILLVTEPGMLSMRGSNVPAYQAYTTARISEFFEWLSKSREADQFDTVGTDSASEMAEISLKESFARNKDGRKAYGDMTKQVSEWLDILYFLPRKHVYMIAKQGYDESVSTSFVGGIPQISTQRRAKPFFPGQELPMKISHRYDAIIQIVKGDVPGVNGPILHFKCKESATVTARDRSGKLDEYEEPNLSKLFSKAMS